MPLTRKIDPVTGRIEQVLEPPPMLTLEEFLELEDLEEVIVVVPQWGGRAVKIRQFSKHDEYTMRQIAKEMGGGEVDRDTLELVMLSQGVVDPPLSVEHIGVLRQKSMGALDTILAAMARINGNTEAAVVSAERQFLARAGEGDAVPSGAGARADGEGASSESDPARMD